MILKIKQNILMENLNYVIKGISNKNIIPILNCIKFTLENDGLYLSSTDNDIAIKCFIDQKDIESIKSIMEVLSITKENVKIYKEYVLISLENI